MLITQPATNSVPAAAAVDSSTAVQTTDVTSNDLTIVELDDSEFDAQIIEKKFLNAVNCFELDQELFEGRVKSEFEQITDVDYPEVTYVTGILTYYATLNNQNITLLEIPAVAFWRKRSTFTPDLTLVATFFNDGRYM